MRCSPLLCLFAPCLLLVCSLFAPCLLFVCSLFAPENGLSTDGEPKLVPMMFAGMLELYASADQRQLLQVYASNLAATPGEEYTMAGINYLLQGQVAILWLLDGTFVKASPASLTWPNPGMANEARIMQITHTYTERFRAALTELQSDGGFHTVQVRHSP